MKNALAICALLSPGCVLAPDSIPLEVEHISHLSQHFDHTPSADQHGGEILSTGFRWRWEHAQLDILEGYCPEMLDRRHEVFQARLSAEIPLHPAYHNPFSHDD